MRKVFWMLVAVCLLTAPLYGQSRRRGYTPAGGWHRKSTTPPPAPRDTKKKTDKRSSQPPASPSPTR